MYCRLANWKWFVSGQTFSFLLSQEATVFPFSPQSGKTNKRGDVSCRSSDTGDVNKNSDISARHYRKKKYIQILARHSKKIHFIVSLRGTKGFILVAFLAVLVSFVAHTVLQTPFASLIVISSVLLEMEYYRQHNPSR